ncbi:hypothetical protein Ddye_029576 [Dipteronia dyeriana]|uniref:RNase H type-1 domain-containing protein n=1 Tax=Dipteronia dyeriana TaxID=168575 RepID=A0AAD9WKQ3_9ROSI|nr:hypothetical protein Ddye_029576 [Dipteronia dyeriana]
MCPICLKKAESSLHALWRCASLKAVRIVCDFVFGHASLESTPFLDFMQPCGSHVGVNEFEFLCILWWRVWHRRSLVVHYHSLVLVLKVMEWAVSFLKEFRSASMVKVGNGKDGRDGDRVANHPWQPPPACFFKINTDAAVNGKGKGSGIGVVIRDCDGKVMASLCRNILANYEPQIAEALAILEGCRLAINHNLMPSVLEFDALVVVRVICKR